MGAIEISSREVNVEPDNKVWEVIRGGYDLHLHVAPDVLQCGIDDIEVARDFVDAGLAGFALRSPYFTTAERARVVSQAVTGIVAHGSLTLNHRAGGLNPVAIDLAGRAGTRLICMPTCDALNETTEHSASIENSLSRDNIQDDPEVKVIVPAPLTVLDADGSLNSSTLQCLDLIAEYKMALCTGHLGRNEIVPLIKAAKDIGVERVIVSNAEFPSVGLTSGEQVELADMGAIIEHCFATTYFGKTAWHTLFSNVAAVGAEGSLLSTGLGQTANPSAILGLASFAERFLNAGFPAKDVRMMVVDNPVRLTSQTEGDG